MGGTPAVTTKLPRQLFALLCQFYSDLLPIRINSSFISDLFVHFYTSKWSLQIATALCIQMFCWLTKKTVKRPLFFKVVYPSVAQRVECSNPNLYSTFFLDEFRYPRVDTPAFIIFAIFKLTHKFFIPSKQILFKCDLWWQSTSLWCKMAAC